MIRRQIELIKILVQQTEYKPASFFSEALHVSTKTIYSDIDDLTKISRDFGLDLIKIPRSGILLDGTEEQKQKLLHAIQNNNSSDVYSKEYRRIEIIKRSMLKSQKLSMTELSQEFIVSKTSLYHDVAVLQEMIKNPLIHFLTTHDRIEVTGPESDIQNGLEHFTLSFHRITSIDIEDIISVLFEKHIIEQVDQLLFNEYINLTEHVSNYYIRGLRLKMIILLARLCEGHHLEKGNDFLFNSIKYMETFIVANSMVEMIKQNIPVDFTGEDIEYLSQQLFAHRITSDLKRADPMYEKTVHTLINRMTEMEKVDFNHDEKLYKSLLYHIPAMIVRLQNGVQIQNPLLNDIKNQYTKLFAVVWYALSFLESKFKVTLNDDEVSLVLIYFQLSLEKLSKIRNIIVVCPYGSSSSQLILNKVKQFLPSRDHIEVATIEKLNKSNLDKIDLIITPVDIDAKNRPCIKVNPLINDEDLTNIMQVYTNQVMRYHQDLEEINQFDMVTTSQYIDIHFIQLQKEYKSKEDCLKAMIQPLENAGYVSKEYRKSILNREKIGSTSLDTGVALPHADPSLVNKPVISITTLKKPIKWGEINVVMVIMVSLSENEIDKFSDVIREIYQMVRKKESVNEIVKIDAIADLMRLFLNR